jgi:hypothetical protein
MAITINGTTGIAGVDGSAGTPAVQGADTNTGMFFPAADTIAFSEGGVEVARFNADAQFVAAAGTALLPVITTTGDVNTGIFFPAADTIAFAEGGAEAMRIDSSGLVGINTTSPSRRLTVASGSAMKLGTATGALFNDTANDGGVIVGSDFAFGNIQGCNAAGTSAKNLTINPEGGECYVGGATDNGPYNLQCIGTGVWGAGAYVNGSDERIKNNIVPLGSGLDVVAKLNPVTYKYKEDWSKDQSTQTGFIAQELLTALEGKNYVDGVVQQGGSESYYSVAYQNIIPILTKAIQEQQALITQLQADVAALKGTP